MKFLPYERLIIHTTLSSEEVLKRVANVIEPERDYYARLSTAHTKPYQGSIVGSHFTISRILYYRDPFLPVIEGDVQTESSGCSVYVTIQREIMVILLTIFLLGGAGVVAVLSLIVSLMRPHTVDPSLIFVPGGIFVIGYILFLGSFKFESIQSKEFLPKLFEARKLEEMGLGIVWFQNR